jgi:hypothetical protein
MTGTLHGRALPLRVPVMDGECLDSWLEALARRNGISVRRLLPAFGWKPPSSAARLSLGVQPGILRRAERQAGLPAGRLDKAVLDPCLPLGPVRRDGSRYCPQCLAGQDGRWMLSWRLPWSFACTTHGVLLHDDCPACGRPPRGNLSRAGLNPAGTCPAPAGEGTRCEADLRDVPSEQASSELLAAQRWLSALLATAASGRDDAARALGDLPIVAGWLMRHAPAGQITAFGPRAGLAWRSWLAQLQPARVVPPASAILTGIAAVLAMPVVRPGDQEAIREIRARMPAGHDPRCPRPPAMVPSQWNRLSEDGRGRFLRAMDPGLTCLDRLRYRSGTAQASIPRATARQLAARARHVPQLLWPGWAVRLMPAEGFAADPFRSAIATCLLLPGKPARAIHPGDGPHSRRSSFAVNSILRSLTAHGHDSVLAAVALLASYLDDHGSPIDYQRRRDTIPATTISKDEWLEACGRARAHPGEEHRYLQARRHAYELLTGADLSDPRCPLAFGSRSDKARYLGFTDTLTTPLRAALHEHAAALLSRLGISEPLTWEPPASCCTGITLPGRDPADIDLDAVTRLVITGGTPPGAAARQMGTTISHVRLALEQATRPAREWARASPPAAWERWQDRARALLTREFFEREHVTARKTLRQIEAETGIPRAHLASRARYAGIPVSSAWQPSPIDPQWLREQYIGKSRSYADIAAELGVIDVTVIAAARRHGIPSRPKGVHSRPEMITTLGDDIPPDIRRAVEGTLHGWQRLHRFRQAVACPAIGIAARQLGAHHSTLIHQFQRLERDIGAPLYYRSSPGHPMRPTARGSALIQALDRPAVLAIAPPPPAGPGTAPRIPQTKPARAPEGQPWSPPTASSQPGSESLSPARASTGQ